MLRGLIHSEDQADLKVWSLLYSRLYKSRSIDTLLSIDSTGGDLAHSSLEFKKMSSHSPSDSLTGAFVRGELAGVFRQEPEPDEASQRRKHLQRNVSREVSTIQVGFIGSKCSTAL